MAWQAALPCICEPVGPSSRPAGPSARLSFEWRVGLGQAGGPTTSSGRGASSLARVLPTVRCSLTGLHGQSLRLLPGPVNLLAPRKGHASPWLLSSSAAAGVVGRKIVALASAWSAGHLGHHHPNGSNGHHHLDGNGSANQAADALAQWASASSAGLQKLQRVGSIIRSTSWECIAALGHKAAAAAAAAVTTTTATTATAPAPATAAALGGEAAGGPPPQRPDGDDDDADDRQQPAASSSSSSRAAAPAPLAADGQQQLKASLGRFVTAASDAEVRRAALLARLADLAYDVAAVDAAELQQQHALTLVTHSRAAPVVAATAPSSQQQQPQQQLPVWASTLALPSPAPLAGSAAAAAGAMPVSPAGSGAPPSASSSWDALPAAMLTRAGSSGSIAGAPTSPRTPFVLSSIGDADDVLFSGGGDGAALAAATAAAPVPAPDAPRRGASASRLGRRAAPAATAVADAPICAPAAAAAQPPSPAGATLASQLLMMHQQQQQQHVLFDPQQQVALEAMQQQELALQLEMHANQQLLLLLQQERAIMAQLQEAADAALGASSSSAAEQQQPSPSTTLQAAAAAEVAAAAAAAAAAEDPADWFVVDAPGGEGDAPNAPPTRVVAIQGSLTLEHWRINLTIDPVEFEGGALGGVQVHRGVYHAAQRLYPSILPHVRAHLAAHPAGKVAFTGHSLGGSLATLLMLLLVHRGELPASSVAEVRTFGAPAIFCEGAAAAAAHPSRGPCAACALPCSHRGSATAAAAAGHGQGGVLERLGLAPDAVANVVMTRDIVPRAFVCDYTLVADVLKSWVPGFREHQGLAACRDHKALYTFVGAVEVLQPGGDCSFVLPGEQAGHGMLPDAPALYKLAEQQQGQQQQQAAGSGKKGCAQAQPSCSSSSSSSTPPPPCGKKQQQQQGGSGGRRSPLSAFGSFASLAGSLSLPSAIAELASTFTLTAPIVTVPAAAEQQQQQRQQQPLAGSSSSSHQVAGDEGEQQQGEDEQQLTLGDAVLAFMNEPHPLTTLGEVRSYGPSGAISRFHNPASYVQALQRLGGGGGGGSA